MMTTFNNDEENKTCWERFWNKEVDGEPLWYVCGMAVLPLYIGFLLSRLGYADEIMPWLFAFMIAGGVIMLCTSLYRGK